MNSAEDKRHNNSPGDRVVTIFQAFGSNSLREVSDAAFTATELNE